MKCTNIQNRRSKYYLFILGQVLQELSHPWQRCMWNIRSRICEGWRTLRNWSQRQAFVWPAMHSFKFVAISEVCTWWPVVSRGVHCFGNNTRPFTLPPLDFKAFTSISVPQSRCRYLICLCNGPSLSRQIPRSIAYSLHWIPELEAGNRMCLKFSYNLYNLYNYYNYYNY